MSSYVISDIHGNRDFWKLLEKAEFSFPNDMLYVAGDIIDRGEDPLGVFTELRKLEAVCPSNVKMLLGNHELFLKMYLTGELSEKTYFRFGGESTLGQLGSFFSDEESRNDLIEYIDKMPVYAAVYSPLFGETVITHVGIDADHIVYHRDSDKADVIRSIEQAFSDDPYSYMIGCDVQRGYLPSAVMKKLDRFLMLGHVPTILLQQGANIIVREHFLDLDTGSSYDGGMLSLYRIDDGEVFQVNG